MKKFLKILTTALGSLMVVGPQFDVYGMETTVQNKGLSLEDQIKEVESFIGSSAANRYIAKNETRHVATAVAVSILGINNDDVFLRSLNATYDEFIKNGRNNNFRRMMGLLNAWIGSESVATFKNEIIKDYSDLDLKKIYKKSVNHIWNLLTDNNDRNWGNVVKKRFGEVYSNKQQAYNSDKSIAEDYFFHDWNLRFVKSQILNFVSGNIIERREFSAQTTIPNVKLLNNNKPELEAELIDTTVKEKNNSLLSKDQSKTKLKNARTANVIIQQVLNNPLSNYLKKNGINIHNSTINRGNQELNPSQKGSSIRQEKIVINDDKDDVKLTSKPVNVPNKNTSFQDKINILNANFSRGSDNKGEKKLINNNKNDSIASKSETIANMVSAINNNVLESSNTVTDKPKVVVGNGAGVPPPPTNIPKPVKEVKTETDRAEVLKNVAKIADAKKKDEAPKKTSNSKTGSGGGSVPSSSGSQTNGKNAPKVQITPADMQAQIAARLAQMKGKQKDQANIENDPTKNVAKSNNFELPKLQNLQNKDVNKGVKTDFTKENSVKTIWDSYKAVCVNSSRGSGNMTNIVKAKGATTGYGHLDVKSNLLANDQTGLNSILASAELLPVRDFENVNISTRYDVDNDNNIVKFDDVIDSLDKKKFARVQLYYILKNVDSLGKIPILTGDVKKDKLNDKRVEKYEVRKIPVDSNLLKQALVPVFAYQHWGSSTSKSTKFIGFKYYINVNLKNFNMATDSDLLEETGNKDKDLARSQLYVIINTLLYKRFNEKWFDDKSK